MQPPCALVPVVLFEHVTEAQPPASVVSVGASLLLHAAIDATAATIATTGEGKNAERISSSCHV